jgi:hypothetical protein
MERSRRPTVRQQHSGRPLDAVHRQYYLEIMPIFDVNGNSEQANHDHA